MILIGAIGNAVAEGFRFFRARDAGRRILEKRVGWAANVERVDRLLKKWDVPVIIAARFAMRDQLLPDCWAPQSFGWFGIMYKSFDPHSASVV